MKQESGAGKQNGLLAVNDLTYLLEPDLSVAVNVTHKNHFFQSTNYDSTQRAVCILNSGADYLDTRGSYLRLKLNFAALTGQDRMHFGQDGSILNIIRTVTVTTRSGDELSRVTDCNHLNAMLNGYRFDKDWVETTGQAIGIGRSFHSKPLTEDNTVFTIPLYLLSDLFAYGRLLPSMVASGLRIELEFERPTVAFCGLVGGAVTTTANVHTVAGPAAVGAARYDYTIEELHINAKSVQLTDATQRALNDQCRTDGLEIVYCDWEKTQARYPNGTTSLAHVEVRKACSRAVKAFVRVRDLANDNLISRDSFASSGRFDVLEYQWQLGSLYFPQQPVKSTTVARPDENMQECYHHMLNACGKVNPLSSRPAIGLNNSDTNGTCAKRDIYSAARNTVADLGAFSTFNAANHMIPNVNILAINGGNGLWGATNNREQLLNNGLIYGREEQSPFAEIGSFGCVSTTLGVNLERSDQFPLSGIPINNSRVLALRIQWGGDDGLKMNPMKAKARIVDVYLKYVKLARVFLNNVEVEE